MASGTKMLAKVIENIALVTKEPEKFLEAQKKAATQLCTTTKTLYDYLKTTEDEIQRGKDSLPELLVKNFDDEQIWQEVELQNDRCISDLLVSVANISAVKDLHFRTLFNEEDHVNGTQGGEEEDSEEEEEDENGMEEEEEEEDEESDFELRLDRESEDESEEEMEMKRALDEEEKRREDEDEDDEEEEDEEKVVQKPRKKRKSVVDDKFFSLADMTKFLEREDRREERRIRREHGEEEVSSEEEDEEEVIDPFAELSSDGEDIHFDDFFDPPDGESTGPPEKKKKKKIEEEEEEEEEEKEEESEDGEEVSDILGGERGKPKEQMSTFEKRQSRIKDKIGEMEDAALSEKPWQLMGEVSSAVRPENSLLQEHLEFDQTTRLAPVITEETTQKLEDLIKQRIKDKSWDDVERKEKPKESATEYKRRIVLDQEKSKQSLSQVYEQEFLRQTQEEEEKEDPEREEIQKALSALFVKLDALSNFRYTPKQAAPDVKIVSNLPAVSVEEVAPTSVSQAAQLAPEEIQSKKKELKGETEKTSTDKKRARRDKKKKQGEKRKAEEEKDKEIDKIGLQTKHSKEKAKRNLEKQSKMGKDVTMIKDDKKAKSGLTSSKQFFSQLQEEVSSQISAKKLAKKKKTEKILSSSKYKL